MSWMAARSRWAGGRGGRKPLTGIDAGLLDALDALVEPETRGDPMTRLRWTTKSTRNQLIGRYARAGREWRPSGNPRRADVHDFPGEQGKAVPYGVYDLGADAGWVPVGSDGDTAQFAVQTIRRWWDSVGTLAYPGTASLLITADAGGSNGCRLRLWKKELAALADATGLAITVCHMPPGTSKWNKCAWPGGHPG